MMDCNEDVLLIFKHKLNELTELALKLPHNEKVVAREYFYANLNSLQNILNDCNVNDGTNNSTDSYLLKEMIANNSSSPVGTEQIATHENIILTSKNDNAQCNTTVTVPVFNVTDVRFEHKNENTCSSNSNTFIYEHQLQNGTCHSSSSKIEVHSETLECSDLRVVPVVPSVSVENINFSSIIPHSSIDIPVDGDANHAVETMSETNGTSGMLCLEDSRNCAIQDEANTQDINGGACVVLQDGQMVQVTAGNNMSQSDTSGVTTSTVHCLTDLNQLIPQDYRNVTILKDGATSDKFLILRVELDDGSLQDFQVPSYMVEERNEQENNDGSLSPSQLPAVNVEPSENSNTSQEESVASTMNLRERPKSVFAQKQKKPGRPKNENIPKPKINSRGEPVYVCEICKTSVKTYYTLLVHMRTHTGSRPFCCDICNKSFTTKGNLKAHAVTHSEDKPWKCEWCSKTFKEKKVLKTHEMIHTGAKPFSCSFCDRAFNQRSTLLEHTLTHSNNRPHLCDICGQGFRGASSLKAHKKRHLGVREYQCDTCNKAFVCRNELTRHTLTHTGERPFACVLCDKSFTRLSYLKEHLNTHSGAKPYVCLQCGDAFAESMSLARHKRKHLAKNDNNRNELDQSVTLEYVDNKSNVNFITEQENYYATAVSEQTVLNNGETLIQVLSDDSTKVEYFQKLRSLLISASGNDCMSNVDTSKQLYQVLCVNPDTQEVVSQGGGHQVIVESHSDDVTPINV